MGVCQQTQWTTDAYLMLWRSKVLFVYHKISNYSKISDYGTSRKVESKYLSVKYLLISYNTGTRAWAIQKLILGVPGGGGTHKLCQNIYLLNICWYQNRPAPKLSYSKIWFLGVHLGGSPGGGTPKLCQNICLLNIYWYQKKVEL